MLKKLENSGPMGVTRANSSICVLQFHCNSVGMKRLSSIELLWG